MNFFLVLLAAYVITLVVISWQLGRNESKEDFLIAGRNRPWWQIMFSKYAATIGAAWYVSYTAFAYEYGFNVLTLILGIAVGYVIFAQYGAPRIRKLSDEGGGFYTVGQLVQYQTKSRLAAICTDLSVMTASFLYLAVGVVAGGVLMESFGLLTYEMAILLTFFIVISYVLLSGYKAVVVTDVLQGVIMLVLLGAVMCGFIGEVGVSVDNALIGREIDILTIAMFAIFGTVATFASPDRYQLSYAGKGISGLKLGMLTAFIPVFLSAAALWILGSMMISVNPNLSGAEVFPNALTSFLNPAVVPFALVMFFAGLMSSADTGLYVLASHWQVVRGKMLTASNIRIVLFVVGLLGLFVSLYFKDIVDLTLLAAAMGIAIAFPMLYVLFGKAKRNRFISVLIFGLIGLALGFSIIGIDPQAGAFVLGGNILGYFMPVRYLDRLLDRIEKVC